LDEGLRIERDEVGLVAVNALVVSGVERAGFFWIQRKTDVVQDRYFWYSGRNTPKHRCTGETSGGVESPKPSQGILCPIIVIRGFPGLGRGSRALRSEVGCSSRSRPKSCSCAADHSGRSSGAIYSHRSFGSSRTLKQMPQLSIMPRKTFCSSDVWPDHTSASRSARLKRP
jgi:hypothetical protein